MLVQDMELPSGMAPLIAASVEQQLEEFASLQEIQANTRPVTINLEASGRRGRENDAIVTEWSGACAHILLVY